MIAIDQVGAVAAVQHLYFQRLAGARCNHPGAVTRAVLVDKQRGPRTARGGGREI